MSVVTLTRRRRCRYCGVEITDDEAGMWHELRCRMNNMAASGDYR